MLAGVVPVVVETFGLPVVLLVEAVVVMVDVETVTLGLVVVLPLEQQDGGLGLHEENEASQLQRAGQLLSPKNE